MEEEPRSSTPSDIAERVDRALNALWRDNSDEFDKLITESSQPEAAIGHALQSVVRHASEQTPVATTIEVPGYRVVREIGRGGMGVVYEAEQLQTQRHVALKVIREPHTLDDYHKRLFAREVLTLARLKHSNIAAIYDAGVTNHGQPFFAMELVHGDAFNVFTATIAPTNLIDKLRLFHRICSAVSYAHQRGVIHRDLKPSNILVTQDDTTSSVATGDIAGDVKILDFGLARLTDAEVPPITVTIDTGRIKGTLAYMSPEQARGDAESVDTRSDVYSLGVILFQTMTGRMPYDIRGVPAHEAVRRICETAPGPFRINESDSRTRPVPTDLRTIIEKALEKEPARRYQSAAAFADDIDRFLNDRPITARPASAAYQLAKFVTRHKVSSMFAGAVLALIIAFAVYANIQANRVAAQRDAIALARDEAANAAAEAKAVNDFLLNMLASADPTEKGRDVKVVELLDHAVRELDESFSGSQKVEGAVRRTLGKTYRALNLFQPAETQIKQAIKLLSDSYGAVSVQAIRARNEWGVLLQDTGQPAEAEKVFQELLRDQLTFLPDDDHNVLATRNNLALIAQERGRYAEAEPLFRQVYEVRRRVLGRDHEDTMESLNNLAGILLFLKQYAEAETLQREALEQQIRVLGEDHPDTLVSYNDLAMSLKAQGNLEDAEPFYRKAWEGMVRVQGDSHLDTLIIAHNVANILRDLGRLDESAEIGRNAVAKSLTSQPADSWYTAAFRSRYAQTLIALGKTKEAETELLAAYDVMMEKLGPTHPYTRETINAIVKLYESAGDDVAAARFREKL